MNLWLSKFVKKDEFKFWNIEELNIKDIHIYSKYIEKTIFPVNVWSSNFAYLWAHTQSNNLKIFKSLINNMLVTFILTKKGRLYLPCLPFGRGSVDEVVEVLIKCANFCYEWNKESKYDTMSTINPINEAQYEFLKTSDKFNKYFKLEQLSGLERHYSIPKIIQLQGKSFRTVREKVNGFKNKYPNAIIRMYNKEDFNSVMKLGEQWENTSGKKYRRIIDGFYFESIIKRYKELDHMVLVAEIDGKIIGMTSGGILPTGQAWGCLTKYNNEYRGLSEFLTVEFAKEIQRINPNVEFINVGSDLGSEGLAFSKERYRPVMNYKRYAVFFQKD